MDARRVRRTVGVQPKTGLSQIALFIGGSQTPESNVMAFARAVIDRFLETDVLTTAEKKKRAERGCWIRRVQYIRANHPQRACNAETIRLRPSAEREGGA